MTDDFPTGRGMQKAVSNGAIPLRLATKAAAEGLRRISSVTFARRGNSMGGLY